jgi:hypothetical protein
MEKIIGVVLQAKTASELREGHELEFTPDPKEFSDLCLKAYAETVSDNGAIIRFDGSIREGILVRQCSVRYKYDDGKVIVQIT